MTRPAFLMITVSACLLGLACAAAQGGGVSTGLALLTLLLACGAHAAANVLNDFHDARNGADAANPGGLFPFTGGSRLIQQGLASEALTQRLGWALMGLVAVGGVALVASIGPSLLPIGLAGLLVAWAYSAPPLKLMSRGLGELAVACAWSGVVVGADVVQRGRIDAVSTALGAGLGLLVANLLLINGVPDALGDAQVGKRTLAVRLGPRGAACLYAGLAVLAHAALIAWVALGVARPTALWGLVSLPLSITAAVLLARHAATPQRLRPAIGLTIAAANVHALVLAAALWLAH